MHHLMGITEVASHLGVTTQRVDQLAHREDFPRPVAELAAGRIWERRTIEQWARRTRGAAKKGRAGG
jgi:predicted DNA-binding transcriptional regulator AlpA